ncbi:hypothetical protein L9F63_002386, partial [Diploptera punctata]
MNRMTMDINIQQRVRVEATTSLINTTTSSPSSSISTRSLPTTTTTIPQRSIKRSFDVAFLMAPDENLAKKQLQQEKQLRLASSVSVLHRTTYSDIHMLGELSESSLRKNSSMIG